MSGSSYWLVETFADTYELQGHPQVRFGISGSLDVLTPRLGVALRAFEPLFLEGDQIVLVNDRQVIWTYRNAQAVPVAKSGKEFALWGYTLSEARAHAKVLARNFSEIFDVEDSWRALEILSTQRSDGPMTDVVLAWFDYARHNKRQRTAFFK